MLLIAVIPSIVWVGLMLMLASALTIVAVFRLRVRSASMITFLVLLAVQTLAAAGVATATSVSPIGAFACLGGIFGILLIPALSLVQAGLLFRLFRAWPVSSAGGRAGFTGWAAVWLLFGLVAFLTHLRSAALCTV